jgi:hypothetical protein
MESRRSSHCSVSQAILHARRAGIGLADAVRSAWATTKSGRAAYPLLTRQFFFEPTFCSKALLIAD